MSVRIGFGTLEVTFRSAGEGAQPDTAYLIVCRECAEAEPTVVPFDTPEARGKWAAAHRDATGHDLWWVKDHRMDSDEAKRRRRELLTRLATAMRRVVAPLQEDEWDERGAFTCCWEPLDSGGFRRTCRSEDCHHRHHRFEQVIG